MPNGIPNFRTLDTWNLSIIGTYRHYTSLSRSYRNFNLHFSCFPLRSFRVTGHTLLMITTKALLKHEKVTTTANSETAETETADNLQDKKLQFDKLS